MSDPTSARDQFGRNAEKYLTSQAHNRPDELMDFIERFNLRGETVVDVGTGAGHVAYALAKECGRVYAHDLAPEMLAIVDRESVSRGLTNIETSLGTAEELPYPDASMDGVACRTAAHHFTDVDAFVHSVSRVLKPGGWFFLQDSCSPEDDQDAEALDKIERLRDPSHMWNFKETEWLELCDNHNLRVRTVEVGRMDIDLQQWLDRMEVSPADQQIVRGLIRQASPTLAKVIEPVTKNGVEFFHLPKITLLAERIAI